MLQFQPFEREMRRFASDVAPRLREAGLAALPPDGRRAELWPCLGRQDLRDVLQRLALGVEAEGELGDGAAAHEDGGEQVAEAD